MLSIHRAFIKVPKSSDCDMQIIDIKLKMNILVSYYNIFESVQSQNLTIIKIYLKFVLEKYLCLIWERLLHLNINLKC